MYRVLLLSLFACSAITAAAQTPSIIICKGSSINYTDTAESTNGTAVFWEWRFFGGTPDTTTSLPETANGKIFSRANGINYPDTGLFLTRVHVRFSNGSSLTNLIYVKVLFDKVQPIPMKDTAMCGAVSLRLDAGNAGLGFTYEWNDNPAVNTRFLDITQPGSYKVRVYNRCDELSKTINVIRRDAPVVNLGPDGFICNDDPRLLDAGNSGDRYLWQPTTDTTQTILVVVSGTYSVRVTNEYGCVGQDEITLLDSCPPTIYLPNVFRPNGDKINDVFRAYYTGMQKITMTIYSRWGEKLYETDRPDVGWDGYYKGKLVENGVYMYIVNYLASNQERHQLKGTFHLVY